MAVILLVRLPVGDRGGALLRHLRSGTSRRTLSPSGLPYRAGVTGSSRSTTLPSSFSCTAMWQERSEFAPQTPQARLVSSIRVSDSDLAGRGRVARQNGVADWGPGDHCDVDLALDWSEPMLVGVLRFGRHLSSTPRRPRREFTDEFTAGASPLSLEGLTSL